MNRIMLAILLSWAVTACARGRSATPVATEVVAVRLAPVTVERIARPVTATGMLGPKEEVTLSFKIGGVIGRIRVDEGNVVQTGDTLAALDLSEIDAGVTRARSAADKADRDLVRAKRLYADSVATLEQVQNAQTGYDVARAELETASFNRRYAVIVAPAGGVILRRTAEPGELVQPGTPILTLGSRSRGAVVRAALADRDVVQVRRGDSAVVRFDALPDRPLVGTVTEIAAAADALTGTYRVEVTVPASGLASGLIGEVEIRPAAIRPLALVPIAAVLEADGSHATVFTVSADGQRAERRAVTIGFLAGDRVAVLSGLEGVRAVVTDGGAYLDDGAKVRVQP
ncbi:MAG TPA: efflux RND transporter periplasmic adaptor subunit [Gemmatimonadales bacterium]|nr:efflux RND transporter periplasmic adaptor subunit [Gemmatimonadales bacterium]